MKLIFKEKLGCIEEFEPVNLPDFTILTGLNGSGKTHLFRAIKNGSIILESVNVDEISHFNYSNFSASREEETTVSQIRSEKQGAWSTVVKETPIMSGIYLCKELDNFKNDLGDSYKMILSFTDEKPLFELTLDELNEDQYLWRKLQKYKEQVNALFSRAELKGYYRAQGIYEVIRKIPVTIDELSEGEFHRLYQIKNSQNGVLAKDISKTFLEYKFNEYLELVLNKTECELRGEKYKISSKEDFLYYYGPKPWEILEEVLNEFGHLEYTISNPDHFVFRYPFGGINFEAKLVHKKNKFNIPFSALSSGERLLFALVLSIYNTTSSSFYPRVLLLDEVDASLHPSMTKSLLNVINNIFVEKYKMKVILATHSPTTVALADEGQVYFITKDPTKIKSQSKSDALNILTEGYITLEEGLHFLDEIVQKKLTLFTEGNNISYIRKALEVHAPELIEQVHFIEDLKERTGKNQLKLLYEFLFKVLNKNQVLFVFDCDVKTEYESNENCHFYIFEKNNKNPKVKDGIENMFSQELFTDDFYKKKVQSRKDGGRIQIFELDKPKFLDYILKKGTKAELEGFQPLINKIKEIVAKAD